MLPYAVTAAARLRRARTILILHDLYPDVLVMAGLLQPNIDRNQGHPRGKYVDVPGAEYRRHNWTRHGTSSHAL
jgi:hypothetical protein